MSYIHDLDRRPVVLAEDLYPAISCCCATVSFYVKYPDCCGFYCMDLLCCVQLELACCKRSYEKDYFCTSGKFECMMGKLKTCNRIILQVFCLDNRCGIPCAPQHPMLCTLCFFTCCYDGRLVCFCCEKFREISGEPTPTEAMQAPLAPSAPSAVSSPVHSHPDSYRHSGSIATAPSEHSITVNTSQHSNNIPMAMVVAADDVTAYYQLHSPA